MPSIAMREIVKEYYELEKHKYPHLSFTDFENVCKSRFTFLHKMVERIDTPTIIFKYFGKFKVFSDSVKKQIKKVEDRGKFQGALRTRDVEAIRHYKQILANVKEGEEKEAALITPSKMKVTDDVPYIVGIDPYRKLNNINTNEESSNFDDSTTDADDEECKWTEE